MKPIGPLMKEHRLIERMVKVLNQQVLEITDNHNVNSDILTLAIDFLRTYADKTHHGKEEDILFRVLAKKELAPEEERMMRELIEEHVSARKMVTLLSYAREAYLLDKSNGLGSILNPIKQLVIFYPMHIAKEDKEFFYPCLRHLNLEEQNNMLHEFHEFDRQLIHDKYLSIVDEVEKKQGLR